MKRFIDIVRPMFKQIHVLASSNNNLRHARDLLLPKLISREINLSDFRTASHTRTRSNGGRMRSGNSSSLIGKRAALRRLLRKSCRRRSRRSNCSSHSAGITPTSITRHSAPMAPKVAPRCARRCCRTAFGQRSRSSTRICRRKRCVTRPPISPVTALRCWPPTPMPKFITCSAMECPCRCAGPDGERKTETARVIDWRDPSANDLMLAQQVWFQGELYKRRADLVGFVNGLPLLLDRTQRPDRERQGRLRQQHPQLPERYSPGLCLQRRRHCLERYGDQGRRDLCAV